MLRTNVKIWDADFHPIDADRRNKGMEGKCKPVVISKDAFYWCLLNCFKGGYY